MIKKLVSASFAAVGLTAAATPSVADFTAINQLTNAERGAWCLIESFLSTAAAAMQAQAGNGCRFTAGTLIIETEADGSGTGSLGNIVLNNAQTNSSTAGSKCVVTQEGDGNLDFIKLKEYTTTPFHAFSRRGDVFIDSATVKVVQSNGAPADFAEHSIKNFEVGISDYQHFPKNAFVIFDFGKEVISKFGFPLTKWVQFSAYARNGVLFPFPLNPKEEIDDHVFAIKLRGVDGGFPSKGTDCAILVDGDFVDVGGTGASVEASFQTADPSVLGLTP